MKICISLSGWHDKIYSSNETYQTLLSILASAKKLVVNRIPSGGNITILSGEDIMNDPACLKILDSRVGTIKRSA